MKAYLDYNATSPVDPAVFEVMKTCLTVEFGNASSFHKRGQKARHAVEDARERLARELAVEPGDIIFTSGGTESDNLAVRGVVMKHIVDRRHLVVSAIEHHAVLHTAMHLEKRKVGLAVVPVRPNGVIDLDALKDAVTDQTALVSLMHANNETGTIQPVKEAAKIAHAKGALFHVDAVQTFGKIKVRPEEIGADLLTLSAHKICGPKGAGALYIKKGVKIEALLHGGHQEKNIRPGTENVAGIAGFGKAADLIRHNQPEESARVGALCEKLADGLRGSIDGIQFNGDLKDRIYNTLNVSFEGIDGEMLLVNLDLSGICVSTGSACTAGSVEPSHVLVALGLPETMIRSAIRFSIGRFTTPEEIDHVLAELPKIVQKLRKHSTHKKK